MPPINSMPYHRATDNEQVEQDAGWSREALLDDNGVDTEGAFTPEKVFS